MGGAAASLFRGIDPRKNRSTDDSFTDAQTRRCALNYTSASWQNLTVRVSSFMRSEPAGTLYSNSIVA